jgi:hypothetical protein
MDQSTASADEKRGIASKRDDVSTSPQQQRQVVWDEDIMILHDLEGGRRRRASAETTTEDESFPTSSSHLKGGEDGHVGHGVSPSGDGDFMSFDDYFEDEEDDDEDGRYNHDHDDDPTDDELMEKGELYVDYFGNDDDSSEESDGEDEIYHDAYAWYYNFKGFELPPEEMKPSSNGSTSTTMLPQTREEPDGSGEDGNNSDSSSGSHQPPGTVRFIPQVDAGYIDPAIYRVLTSEQVERKQLAREYLSMLSERQISDQQAAAAAEAERAQAMKRAKSSSVLGFFGSAASKLNVFSSADKPAKKATEAPAPQGGQDPSKQGKSKVGKLGLLDAMKSFREMLEREEEPADDYHAGAEAAYEAGFMTRHRTKKIASIGKVALLEIIDILKDGVETAEEVEGQMEDGEMAVDIVKMLIRQHQVNGNLNMVESLQNIYETLLEDVMEEVADNTGGLLVTNNGGGEAAAAGNGGGGGGGAEYVPHEQPSNFYKHRAHTMLTPVVILLRIVLSYITGHKLIKQLKLPRPHRLRKQPRPHKPWLYRLLGMLLAVLLLPPVRRHLLQPPLREPPRPRLRLVQQQLLVWPPLLLLQLQFPCQRLSLPLPMLLAAILMRHWHART